MAVNFPLRASVVAVYLALSVPSFAQEMQPAVDLDQHDKVLQQTLAEQLNKLKPTLYEAITEGQQVIFDLLACQAQLEAGEIDATQYRVCELDLGDSLLHSFERTIDIYKGHQRLYEQVDQKNAEQISRLQGLIAGYTAEAERFSDQMQDVRVELGGLRDQISNGTLSADDKATIQMLHDDYKMFDVLQRQQLQAVSFTEQSLTVLESISAITQNNAARLRVAAHRTTNESVMLRSKLDLRATGAEIEFQGNELHTVLMGLGAVTTDIQGFTDQLDQLDPLSYPAATSAIATSPIPAVQGLSDQQLLDAIDAILADEETSS